MRPNANADQAAAAVELACHFETQPYAHAGALVLERLPSGEHGWLRPEPPRCNYYTCEQPALVKTDGHPRCYQHQLVAGVAGDCRYVLTDQGRRALREAELFGDADA